uniref:Uncharacterized protein n=1 Tax=Meloidogyne enterolobii TaxID=390850 RepID=A0A6V7U8C5_MELEN|nr:unnamed protein product [Meloidogyne enterolobii]
MFGFAKFFVKFFLEELNKIGYSSENEENENERINWGNWVEGTEEFLNNCYIIWEKIKQTYIDNAESAKMKTKKVKIS